MWILRSGVGESGESKRECANGAGGWGKGGERERREQEREKLLSYFFQLGNKDT